MNRRKLEKLRTYQLDNIIAELEHICAKLHGEDEPHGQVDLGRPRPTPRLAVDPRDN